MVMSDRMRFFVIPTLFTVCAMVLLVSLGNWQIERLRWKRELIAAVTERPTLAPVAAPGPQSWVDFDIERFEYRPIVLEGRYEPGEVHVYTNLPRPNGPQGGQGFWIMAPFTTSNGWSVIINRGFVPGANKDPASRTEPDRKDGAVRLVGLVRRAALANDFTPENDLDANHWYLRDPAEIGRHFGIPADRLAPYSVDLVAGMTAPGGLPQAGETRMSFTNSHLQYAVTWYGLALALLGVYTAFMWHQWRGRKSAGN